MLSQPDSCYISMSSLFSLLLVPHLLSHRCSCHCLESAVCVKKRNKICPPSRRRNDAGRSMLLLWPEIFPCRLHSWRRWLSQPRGLVTVTRTWFAVVLAQTFGVRLPGSGRKPLWFARWYVLWVVTARWAPRPSAAGLRTVVLPGKTNTVYLGHKHRRTLPGG